MRLYVDNLPNKINDARLHELTLPFGKPQSANVARYLADGSSKGFGFIDYVDADEGRAAIAGLHGKNVDGQVLAVFETTAKTGQPWSRVLRTRG
jgi:RNA recognition motif-containing protein